MRTRNALERLAAVAPTEPLLDAGKEDRILQRILASDRHISRQKRPVAVVLVAAVAVGAAIVAYATHGHTTSPPATIHHATLNGARIEAAGYRFTTPAGFKSSDASCEGATSPGGPETPAHAMRSAASADGGCVEALYLIAGSPTAPTPSMTGQPVDVGPFQGYYDAQGDSGATLYVELPQASAGGAAPIFLALYAQGLTEDQMIAVAESGLPASP
jgi:hypothetical protein